MLRYGLLAAAGLMFLASHAAAVMTYEFTVTGEDLMEWTVTTPGSSDGTPVDKKIHDGARKATISKKRGGVREKRSFWGSQVNSFIKWSNKTNLKMAQFNHWGYGGADALGYGGIFLADPNAGIDQNAEWVFDSGDASNPMWTSSTTMVDGNEVLSWYANDGYQTGLPIPPANGINYPDYSDWTFSFALNLADDFDGWFNNVEGDMVFWFGGTLTKQTRRGLIVEKGKYEGNMILSGSQAPIPEPATMFLFGTGLFGLAAVSRRRK